MTDEASQSGRIRELREKHMSKTGHNWRVGQQWLADRTSEEHGQAAWGRGPPGLLLMGHNFKHYRILLGRGNNF